MTRVFVIDDHAVVREAVRLICDEDPELVFAGEASSVVEAAGQLKEDPPDVVLLDLGISSATDLVAEMSSRWSRTRVLLLGEDQKREEVDRALAAGATGVISKTAEPAEIGHAIRRTAKPRPERRAAVIVSSRPTSGMLQRLTPREREVLTLLAEGRTNAEIGRQLGISVRTVASHVTTIYRKLRVTSRTEAARIALTLDDAP